MRLLALAALSAALISPAAAANWTVDTSRSTLGFELAMSGQPIVGSFGSWTADIRFDPADLANAHVKATIDLNSANTGNASRDKALPTGAWFDTGGTSFTVLPDLPPGQAVFEAGTFRQTGEGAYEADGTLTMRGVSQPVTLPFTLQIDGASAHMTGRTSIDRTQWGIGQGEYADDTPVTTRVDVVIDLTATAQ